jgi:hypothetical protein
MAKVRFQMFLEERQKEALEKLQQDSKVSVAGLVRVAIDKFLLEKKKGKKMPVPDKATMKLLSVIGICEGPPDLADEHDKYLYGINKS